MNIWNHISEAIQKRILILDGAMGTMLQGYSLDENDYRGERFADWPSLLKGNNDLLCLTQPHIVGAVHEDFLRVGSDMIETNSFNANALSQADYGLADMAPEIARASAKIAREAAQKWTEKTPDKPRAVLGAIGPLSKTLSLSPKVEDPGYRDVDFDKVVVCYTEQALAMFDYVDGFLIETVFDTLNCKAAIYAIQDVFKTKGKALPLLISGTITDKSGRTLSGQTTEAFWTSIAHAKPFAVGLNCALGAEELRPYVQTLSKIVDTYVLAYPNAGLPNAFGEYDQTAQEMGALLGEWASEGFVNILGGCCGSTPQHIQAIARAVGASQPRIKPSIPPALTLSGLEPFVLAG